MGKYEKAVQAFNEALKIDKSDVKIYNNLGMALSKLGRYELAMEAFKKCGDESKAYNNIGFVYLKMGERDKAIRSFEKAIESRPTFYLKASENLKKAKMERDHTQPPGEHGKTLIEH
jgi:Tfp pilus assembly protein PilF